MKLRYVALGTLVAVLIGAFVLEQKLNPTAGVNCGGPQRVTFTGHWTLQQRNVLTCYVHALARRDLPALQNLTVVENRVGSEDIEMAADAAAGPVHARTDDDLGIDGVDFIFADHKILGLNLKIEHAFWRPYLGRAK